MFNDLAAWNVHGPVHTLRTEHTEWDVSREEWQPVRHYGISRFRPDGKILESEGHNFDGSISRSTYVYDDSTRLLEIRYGSDGVMGSRTLYRYDEFGRHIQTLEVAADESTRESAVTSYDSDGRKKMVQFLVSPEPGVMCGYDVAGFARDDEALAETVVEDAHRRVLCRFVFARDSQGRLLTATQLAGERSMEGFENAMKDENPEKRKQAAAAIASIFGAGQTMSTVTCTYDAAGRMVERHLAMGPRIGPVELGGHRTTYLYDASGLETGNIVEDYSREFRRDQNGNMRIGSERSSKQHVRFEYVHDARGNWTERVVWSRTEPNPEFQRSNAERREIGYY